MIGERVTLSNSRDSFSRSAKSAASSSSAILTISMIFPQGYGELICCLTSNWNVGCVDHDGSIQGELGHIGEFGFMTFPYGTPL